MQFDGNNICEFFKDKIFDGCSFALICAVTSTENPRYSSLCHLRPLLRNCFELQLNLCNTYIAFRNFVLLIGFLVALSPPPTHPKIIHSVPSVLLIPKRYIKDVFKSVSNYSFLCEIVESWSPPLRVPLVRWGVLPETGNDLLSV